MSSLKFLLFWRFFKASLALALFVEIGSDAITISSSKYAFVNSSLITRFKVCGKPNQGNLRRLEREKNPPFWSGPQP